MAIARHINPRAVDMDALVRSGHVEWYPNAAIGKSFPDVPEAIAEAAREATESFSMNHYRAAAILARAVVEAVANEQKMSGHNLKAKIEAMRAGDLIRKHTKEAADEIRFIGNEMAHGEFTTPIAADEAEDVLNFMSEILDEVYQGPARLNRSKSARAARKGAQTGQSATP